jgi:hypothetical protein
LEEALLLEWCAFQESTAGVSVIRPIYVAPFNLVTVTKKIVRMKTCEKLFTLIHLLAASLS